MASPQRSLTVEDHSRDSVGMTYVYPVVSRRAHGVSVGINLNPNNACNWRCVYCQVPGLVRGGPPPIGIVCLEDELRRQLDDIVRGSFMAERVPAEMRRLVDVAFSGNGEPTSAAEFPAAVEVARRVMADMALEMGVKLRLITNGSLLDRRSVRAGIAMLGEAGGEVWFKLDAATPAGMQRINGTRQNPTAVARRLLLCGELCATWVQSCFFLFDGKPPTEDDVRAYLDMLDKVRPAVAGVHVYGLARPSCQPGNERLSRLPAEWLEELATRIRRLGLTVEVSP